MLQLLGAPPHPSAASGTRAIRQSSPGHRSHPIEATAQSDRAEKESTSARQGFKCLVMGLTVGYSDFERVTCLMVVSLFECPRVLVPDEVVAPWAEAPHVQRSSGQLCRAERSCASVGKSWLPSATYGCYTNQTRPPSLPLCRGASVRRLASKML